MEGFIVDSWTKSALRHKQLKSSKAKENGTSQTDKDHPPDTANGEAKQTSTPQKNDQVLSQENLSFEGSPEDALSQGNLSSDGVSDNESEFSASAYHTPSHSNTNIQANGDIKTDEKSPPVSPVNEHCIDVTSDSELPMISFKKIDHDKHLDIHDDDDDDHEYDDVSTAWVTSFWTQFTVLAERTFKQSKHVVISKLSLTQTILLALLVGLIWYRIPYTAETIRDRYAMIFFVMTYWNFNPMFTSLMSFPSERTVINKERAAGYYRLSAYYLGKLVSELPLILFQPVLFITIDYWMTGLNESVAFLQFVFTLLLTCFSAQSVGLLISASVTDFMQSVTIASVYGLGCMLLGGFYQQHIPSWLTWFEYVSYLTYSYEALLITEFQTSKPFSCGDSTAYAQCLQNKTYVEGPEVLEHLEVRMSYGANIACLLGFGILARIFTYIALRFLHKPK